jgi:hypothetical protein
MRQILSVVLALAMLPRLAPAAPDTTSVKTQIVGMPLGTNIELRLKNKQKMRGARGAVSDSGFALVDARAGEHQIAFDDVVSVKQFTTKSHTTRNILIGVGIAVAALGITAGILLRCGPLGCHSNGLKI